MSKPESQNDFSSRLNYAKDRVGGLQALSNSTNIPTRTIQDWEAGNSEPRISRISLIADVADVKLDWLVDGIGPKHRSNSPIEYDIPEISANLSKLGINFDTLSSSVGTVLSVLSSVSDLHIPRSIPYDHLTAAIGNEYIKNTGLPKKDFDK